MSCTLITGDSVTTRNLHVSIAVIGMHRMSRMDPYRGAGPVGYLWECEYANSLFMARV